MSIIPYKNRLKLYEKLLFAEKESNHSPQKKSHKNVMMQLLEKIDG